MKNNLRPQIPDIVPAKVFIPVVLSMILFIGTFFGYILPKVEDHLMDKKREMISALSESAMSSIRYYHHLAETGKITLSQAQQQAIEHLRSIRYGPEKKDYFWINDTHPTMIMHPYRPDLEGKDVTDTRDPAGKKLFLAFLETVKDSGAGYVSYHWQWQDDPTRIFSKISYVQEYRPWHWIVGTGVYVEDVRAQIEAITKRMSLIFLAILVIIAMLSLYIIWQGAAGESDRRKIQESLRKSENKYRLLAETAREIILVFDTGFRINYANRAWSAITGYPFPEASNWSLADLIHPEHLQDFKEKIMRIFENRTDNYLLETVLLLKDGSDITIEATFAPMESRENPATILMTARDITERKKREQQAKMQQEQLMHTNKMVSLGTLVSGVAHEINNPISSVNLNIRVFEKFWYSVQPILDSYLEKNEDFKVGDMAYVHLRERMPKLLNFSQEGVDRVKRIVGDLKDFSGQKPSELRETVYLNRVVDKSVGLVSSLIKKATDNFTVEYEENLPTLQGNSQRLGQVVINLVVNGCQALSDPSQSLTIRTGYLEESEEIFFEVQDQGAGMNETVLARITDPFFTTKRDSSGTGLGLSISDTIVRNHGGRLDFRSKPGEGTLVTVLLPRFSNDEIIGRMV